MSAAEPATAVEHYFMFSTNWRGGKRLCGQCGEKYEDGQHIEVNVLKPFTSYVCPTGGGYGHSSTWSGSQDVPELRTPRDIFCACGLEFVEEDAERWELTWEMRTPGAESWRPVSVVRSKHAVEQQRDGLLALIEQGEPIRSVSLERLVPAGRAVL